jgi:hypothetical protein
MNGDVNFERLRLPTSQLVKRDMLSDKGVSIFLLKLAIQSGSSFFGIFNKQHRKIRALVSFRTDGRRAFLSAYMSVYCGFGSLLNSLAMNVPFSSVIVYLEHQHFWVRSWPQDEKYGPLVQLLQVSLKNIKIYPINIYISPSESSFKHSPQLSAQQPQPYYFPLVYSAIVSLHSYPNTSPYSARNTLPE